MDWYTNLCSLRAGIKEQNIKLLDDLGVKKYNESVENYNQVINKLTSDQKKKLKLTGKGNFLTKLKTI